MFNFMLPSGIVLTDNPAPSQRTAGVGQAPQQAGMRRSPVPLGLAGQQPIDVDL